MAEAVRTICTFMILGLLVACGDKIRRSCNLDSDCSQSGARECDPAPNSPGGYCTIVNCDIGSCPGEAVCVRFFAGAKTDLECDPTVEDISEDRCLADEICTLAEVCVPRTTESRFCMLRCSTDDDCRPEYECRDEELMKAHGGEPVRDRMLRCPSPGILRSAPLG